MSPLVQEIVALAIVAVAALYMLVRLTGWPRLALPGLRGGRKKACGTTSEAATQPVVLGARLARGLRARKR